MGRHGTIAGRKEAQDKKRAAMTTLIEQSRKEQELTVQQLLKH